MKTNRYIVQQRLGVWGILDALTCKWTAVVSFQVALTAVYTMNHDPENV